MKTALLCSVLLGALAGPAAAATMPAVHMTFVDADTNSPVTGAIVLFQAGARQGTFTGHGGKTVALFAVEAVTDDAGAVRFPKQDFSAQPFFLNTNYENPAMVVLKPGYALLALIGSGVPHEVQTVTTWDYNNQTARMTRAPDTEIRNIVWSAATWADRAMASRSFCEWKKIPRFLVAVDRLAAADPALRVASAGNPLQRLFQNDALFVEKGCGSPKAFFAPYLR